MVSSAAQTVEAYLSELPAPRRAVVAQMRALVNAHLPGGYEEGMAYGMIGWSVPLARYPGTYNGQPLGYVGLAAQKNAYSLYLMGCHADPAQLARLRQAATEQDKRLDMGKSCLRFRRPEDLPLDAIGELIASMPVEAFVALYEANRPVPAAKPRGRSRSA